MDSEGSEGFEGLVGLGVILVLIAFIIQAAIQALIWVGQAVAMMVAALAMVVAALVAVGVVILFFGALGAGANLGVRFLIAGLGDWTGSDREPQVCRNALAFVYLAPLALGVLFLPFVFWGLSLTSDASIQIGFWLLVVLISLPTYYVTWWAYELSGGKWKLNLPFRTEATMRVEERLLWGRLVFGVSNTIFRLRLLGLRIFGGRK